MYLYTFIPIDHNWLTEFGKLYIFTLYIILCIYRMNIKLTICVHCDKYLPQLMTHLKY